MLGFLPATISPDCFRFVNRLGRWGRVWGLAEFAASPVRAAFGFPARILRNLFAAMRGSAPITFRTARQPTPLLSRREALARDLAKAKRQHRPSKRIYSALRAVNHQILARGVK